jgi:hypothetical protein
MIRISNAKRQRNLNLSLSQKWEFKLKPDENGQSIYIKNLISHDMNTRYDFEKTNKKWDNIFHRISFAPGDYDLNLFKVNLSQTYNTTQNPYEHFNLISWSIKSTINFTGDAQYYTYFPLQKNDFITGNYAQPDSLSHMDNQILTINDLEKLEKPGSWSLNVTHDYDYNRHFKNQKQEIRNSLNAKITENWGISYSNYYNIKKHQLNGQSFSINREVHCWRILFTYNRDTKYWGYSVVFFNIKLPDSLRLQTQGNSF